jgi:hypothetical protein
VVDVSAVACVCGSIDRIEEVDPVDAGEQMGRIVGGAVAKVFAPGDGLSSALMGGLGAFIGRRMGRGHPLISVGYATRRPNVKKARVKQAKSEGNAEGNVDLVVAPKKKRLRKKKLVPDDKP